MLESTPKHILISRTDGIGDVILTLPMATALKRFFPNVKITFLGRSYTQTVIEACISVDNFLDWDRLSSLTLNEQMLEMRTLKIDLVFHVFPRKEVVEMTHEADIPVRVGTARRWHTLKRVNRKLWYSRKGSDLHEAQLNLKMLEALGVTPDLSLETIAGDYALKPKNVDVANAEAFLKSEFKILLHPLSHGSALEWPLTAFAELAARLADEGIAVGVTGTANERELMGDAMPWDKITDFGGQLDLDQLLFVIANAEGLVAASTGPLHMAAATGIHALGLYSPKRPIFPTRWKPIGPKAEFMVSATHPEDGKLDISVDQVFGRILEWKASR